MCTLSSKEAILRTPNSIKILKKMKKEKISTKFFGLWSAAFVCTLLNGLILLDSKWMITNRKKSMTLAVGDVYWKGLFGTQFNNNRCFASKCKLN